MKLTKSVILAWTCLILLMLLVGLGSCLILQNIAETRAYTQIVILFEIQREAKASAEPSALEKGVTNALFLSPLFSERTVEIVRSNVVRDLIDRIAIKEARFEPE